MSEQIQPKLVERNAWRDRLQDGLIELFFGAYLLLLALMLQYNLIGFIAFLVIFAPLAIKRLKERYTYPRLGYVVFPTKTKYIGPIMLALLVVALVVIASTIILTGGSHDTRIWYKWTPLLPAILLQGVLIPIAIRSRLIRYYILAILTVTAGVLFSLLNLPGKLDNVSLYLMTVGAFCFLWGMIMFLVFLRKYPVQAQEVRNGKQR